MNPEPFVSEGSDLNYSNAITLLEGLERLDETGEGISKQDLPKQVLLIQMSVLEVAGVLDSIPHRMDREKHLLEKLGIPPYLQYQSEHNVSTESVYEPEVLKSYIDTYFLDLIGAGITLDHMKYVLNDVHSAVTAVRQKALLNPSGSNIQQPLVPVSGLSEDVFLKTVRQEVDQYGTPSQSIQ